MSYTKADTWVLQQIAATGLPLVGGVLYAYIWDTSTPLAMYTNSAGSGSATSFTLNSLGMPQSAGGTAIDIYLDDAYVYKFILRDSDGNQVGPTIGPVYPSGGNGLTGTMTSMEALRASSVSFDYIETVAFYEDGTTGAAKLYRDGTGTPTGSGAAVIAAALAAGTFCNAGGYVYKLAANQKYNPLMFGCPTDGTSDSSAAFQSCATFCAGKAMFVDGAYEYTFNSAVTLPSKIGIYGENLPKIKQGIADINLFDLSDTTNHTIEGIWFDGNSLGTTASSYLNCGVMSDDTTALVKYSTVKYCKFTGFYSWAISFAGPGGGASGYSSRVKILHCEIDGQIDEGINFYYIKHFRAGFLDITDNAKEAIKATTATHGRIYYCNVEVNNTAEGPAINLGTDVDRVDVEHCYVNGGSIGIGLEKGVTNSRVKSCTCEGQGTQSIGVSDTVTYPSGNSDNITIEDCITDGTIGVLLSSNSGTNLGSISIKNLRSTNPGTNANINATNVDKLQIHGGHLKDAGAGRDNIATANCGYLSVGGGIILEGADNHGADIASTTYVIFDDVAVINPNANASKNFHGISIANTCTVGIVQNVVVTGSAGRYNNGVNNLATNRQVGKIYAVGYTGAPVRLTTGRTGTFSAVQLGCTDSTANTNTPSGATARQMPVYDEGGTLLGYVPIYGSAW